MAAAQKRIHWPTFGFVCVASVVVALWCRLYFRSDWFEVTGFVTGVVAVYLAAREHIWNWPIGIVQVLVYAYVFFNAALYADMSLQFVYFVLLIHGWYSWKHVGKQRVERTITALSGKQWILLLTAIAIGTIVYIPIISYFKGAAPFWDSLLAVASLGAQVLLNQKFIENWLLWIVIDIAYVPLYISRELHVTAILYAIFLVLAGIGYLNWRRTLAANQLSVT